MQSKAKAVIIGLVLAVLAVVVTAVYRSQAAPGLVVGQILKYWHPGYHDTADRYWLPDVNYEVIYRVLEYRVLKVSIEKDTADVLVKLRQEIDRRPQPEEIYTFVLKKTNTGWKASRYYKGFASSRRAVTSLQDVLRQSPAANP